jgi:hypothetical protein
VNNGHRDDMHQSDIHELSVRSARGEVVYLVVERTIDAVLFSTKDVGLWRNICQL